MSRIGKLPVIVPPSVQMTIDGAKIMMRAGDLSVNHILHEDLSFEWNDNVIKFVAKRKTSDTNMLLGMTRSIVNNMVNGLANKFIVTLEVNGVGYKMSNDKDFLTLSLGFSHDLIYAIPHEIEIKCEKPNLIIISGHSKERVGLVASEISKLRGPEPYKGKGIKKLGQKIIRKSGKKK